MIKTLTHIDCPKEWDGLLDYGSHRPMLWLALNNTEGLVVELGSGVSSTPLLQDYCREKNREFITYENNKEWAEKTGSVYTNTYFKELDKVGLLFVDSAPGEERKDLIEHYRNDADVIVLHDTEIGCRGIYGIIEILKSFKYRIDFTPPKTPATTALSDTINVSEWI